MAQYLSSLALVPEGGLSSMVPLRAENGPSFVDRA